MLGKTHLAVGTAVTLAVMKPNTFQELLIGTGAAVIGAVISDIDVGTSESSKDADKIIGISVAAIGIIFLLDYIGKTNVINLIQSNSSWLRITVGSILFLGVCIFGKRQPHRSFMHSFLALAILSALMEIVLPTAVPYFAFAFLTHLITDLFNFKKVQLFYPLPGGFCFKVFHARGIVNRFLFTAGSVITFFEISFRVWNMIG